MSDVQSNFFFFLFWFHVRVWGPYFFLFSNLLMNEVKDGELPIIANYTTSGWQRYGGFLLNC